MHEIAQNDRHHWHTDKQGDKNGENFWNENQRHFLNLSQGLQQRDSYTDDKPYHHDWSAQLDAEPDSLADQVHDFCFVHDSIVSADRMRGKR